MIVSIKLKNVLIWYMSCLRTISYSIHVWCCLIFDNSRRFFKLHILLEKLEVWQYLQDFCAYTKKQFCLSIKSPRINNGTEFMYLVLFFNSKAFIKCLVLEHCIRMVVWNGNTYISSILLVNFCSKQVYQPNFGEKISWLQLMLSILCQQRSLMALLHTKFSIQKLQSFETPIGISPFWAK